MTTTIDWQNKKFSNDRALLRKEIITAFLQEAPGTGRGDNASKYKYTVKTMTGIEMFLQRPARFNKGIDFTLNVQGMDFYSKNRRKTSKPSHDNIIEDLRNKKVENAYNYQILFNAIEQIFHCQDVQVDNLHFHSGMPVEILLECIKWLFIEQDITYWNYSGRQMLFDGICAV